MNATQAANLRTLITHMEGLSRKLHMRQYFNECGTPACAMGEACTIPALIANGLEMKRSGLPGGFAPAVMGSYDDRGERFFGISRDVGDRLFATANYNAFKSNDVTPQEWAIEARKVLAENGYSMDDKPAQTSTQKYLAFRAKVLEPVAVTA